MDSVTGMRDTASMFASIRWSIASPDVDEGHPSDAILLPPKPHLISSPPPIDQTAALTSSSSASPIVLLASPVLPRF
ncbi:hypothetical protein ZWY2020_019728 [Hordeum vulgare]|nr:hypothetical protein ZWY2020_019728 [Hordeum vulgare]